MTNTEIKRIWFDAGRIYAETTQGETLWQLLCYYPVLEAASPRQREQYELEPFGIHWEELDEDISNESFRYPELKTARGGTLQQAFLAHPELNVSAVARRLGIRQSLLACYINGAKTPSPERKAAILDALHAIGASLQRVAF